MSPEDALANSNTSRDATVSLIGNGPNPTAFVQFGVNAR
jgi:hypothetical protein